MTVGLTPPPPSDETLPPAVDLLVGRLQDSERGVINGLRDPNVPQSAILESARYTVWGHTLPSGTGTRTPAFVHLPTGLQAAIENGDIVAASLELLALGRTL